MPRSLESRYPDPSIITSGAGTGGMFVVHAWCQVSYGYGSLDRQEAIGGVQRCPEVSRRGPKGVQKGPF